MIDRSTRGAQEGLWKVVWRIWLLLFVASWILIAVYWLSAGKAPPEAAIVQSIFIPTWFALVIAYAIRKQGPTKEPPEPIRTTLKTALQRAGLSDLQLVYWERGASAQYPNVMATRKAIFLSKRVCEEWTPEALVWSATTEVTASVGPVKYMLTLPVVLVLEAIALGFYERWQLSSVWLLPQILLLIAWLVVLGILDYQVHVASDRQFTTTDIDRAAAKEALSYAYFAQADKPILQKWMYLRAELRGRARRLGIELERGFKASTATDPK